MHALVPANQPVPSSVLAHPEVSTIVLRSTWPTVEPRPGAFDFSYLEGQLARVASAGKQASLVISSGGVNTPDWLRQSTPQMLRFRDGVRFHATYGQWLEIPTFWDPVLLAAQTRLIVAMGERLATSPGLALVSVQCANATTDDWNIPADADAVAAWRTAGFDEARLAASCQTLLDATARAFPHQLVRMAVGTVPGPLNTGNPHAVAQAILAHAQARWPDRVVLQRHNLSANSPHTSSGRTAGWAVVMQACPACAGQFLAPAVDTRTCRLAGGRMPCDAAAMFDAAASAAIAMGLRYVEVYGADLQSPALAPSVRRLAHELSRADAPGRDAAQRTGPASAGASDATPSRLERAQPAASASTRVDAGFTVRQVSFESRAYGGPRRFGLWLPPGYDAGTDRYPVLYWLHGKGGDPSRSVHLARHLANAIDRGLSPPMLMVFPDGDNDSFYADSPDGRSPAETMLISDLIPFVDREYRTIAERAHRHIEGFSMGGFGALKLAAKHPHLFASVVAYGAPRLDADLGMGGADRAILAQRFGGDIEAFRRETPVWWFTRNRQQLLDLGLRVRIVAGTRDGTRHSVERMHQVLTRLEIPHQYGVLDGVVHAPAAYYEADQGAGFALHAAGSAATPRN